MTNPFNFIANTDYATLKNIGSGSGTIVIPGSVAIAASAYYETHIDITLGQAGAVTRSRIRSNKEGSKWRIGGATDSLRTGINSANPATYDVYAFVWQPSPNVIRFSALIQNPYASPLTGATGNETIDFYTNTFIPPFA